MRTVFLVFLLFVPALGLGREVDNFSNRDKMPADGSDKVNALINGRLEDIIFVANSESPEKCDKQRLVALILHGLDTNDPSVVEDIRNDSDRSIKINGCAILKGMPQGILARLGGCDPVMNINGHRVGLDKIDHMLSAGFYYYLKFHKEKDRGKPEKEALNAALDMGDEHERGAWGLYGTGVKSYGDLAANYSGFLFYMDLLEKPDANIRCVNGQYALAKRVDVRRYVDHAFDESLNCSSYPDRQTEKKFNDQIARITGGKSCPVEPDKCNQFAASEKYQHVKEKMIHPNCLNPNKRQPAVEEALGTMKSINQLTGELIL